MSRHQGKKEFPYAKMTTFKSLKNRVFQKIITIIGTFLRRRSTSTEHNIYQNIVYQPVAETEFREFKVTGEIPQHLNGLLLRIGSNPIHVQNPTLFDWY